MNSPKDPESSSVQRRRRRASLRWWLLVVSLLVVGLVYWEIAHRAPGTTLPTEIDIAAPVRPSAPADETPLASAPVPVDEPEVGRSPVAQPDINTAEARLWGTNNMLVAHASLRIPEVADPDSATNRRTLQSLVEMAQRKRVVPKGD